MAQRDDVSFENEGVQRYAEERKITRDFCRGTTAVHNRADIYTPREGIVGQEKNREHIDIYRQRSTWTEVYSAVKAAKDAAVGLVLAQPPSLGADTPEVIRSWAEDVDGQGNHLMIFSRNLLDEVMQDGLNGVLVDLPQWPEGVVRTEENRIKNRIRPLWSRYSADDIINWDYERIGASYRFTLLVFEEYRNVRTGMYATEEVEFYREIRLDTVTGVVSWKLWKEIENEVSPDASRYVLDSEGVIEAKPGVPLGYIPFVPFYGQKPDQWMICAPPLAPIAELNLGYYRIVSDRRWSMRLHFSPTLVIIGREPDADGTYPAVRLGVGSTIDAPIGGSAQFIAPGGLAFEPSDKELLRISQEMGSLSLAFLANDRGRQAETATARRLESESGKANLALSAQLLQDGLERLFQITGEFLGLSPEEVDKTEVQVRLTYDLEKLDAPTITALNTVVKDNNISLETFLQILKIGGVMPENVDPNEEEVRITMSRIQAEQAALNAVNLPATAVVP